MSDQSTSNFTEILDLGVDVGGFKQDLSTLEDAYTDFVKRLNAKGDVNLGGASMAQLSESMKTLFDSVQALKTGVSSAFAQMAESAQDFTTQSSIESKQQVDMAKSASEARVAFAEEETAKRIELLEKVTTAEKQAAEIKTSGSSSAHQSKGQGFMAGLAGNGDLAGQIGGFLRLSLVWGAIIEAAHLVFEAIMLPFKAIKAGIGMVEQGFTYLQGFEQRAAQLKGVLLDALTFDANDPVRNLKLAGEAADDLTRKIENLALKLRVSTQSIQSGLATFLSYGGRNLVHNNDEAVDVVGYATAALQARNPRIQARQLDTEIQNLVQGVATNGSHLGPALGISAEKMQEIAKHAQTSKDLLQQIVENSPGLTQRLQEAGNTQQAMTAALERFKERWEGLVAGPVFKQFTVILKDILDWLDKHQAALAAIGVSFGQVLEQIVKVSEAFVKSNWSDFVLIFKSLAGYAASFATSIGQAVNNALALAEHFSEASHSASRIRSETGNFDAQIHAEAQARDEAYMKQGSGELPHAEAQKLIDAADARIAELSRQKKAATAEILQQEDAAMNRIGANRHKTNDSLDSINSSAHSAIAQTATELLHPEITSGSPAAPVAQGTPRTGVVPRINKQHSTALQDIRDEYNAKAEAIKDGEDRIRKAAQNGERDHTISVQEAERERQASYTREIIGLRELAEQMKLKYAEMKGVTAKQAAHFNSQLETQLGKQITGLSDRTDDSQSRVRAEDRKIADETWSGYQKRRLDAAESELALNKQRVQHGEEAVTELERAEERFQDRKYQIELDGLNRTLALFPRESAEYNKALQDRLSANQRHQEELARRPEQRQDASERLRHVHDGEAEQLMQARIDDASLRANDPGASSRARAAALKEELQWQLELNAARAEAKAQDLKEDGSITSEKSLKDQAELEQLRMQRVTLQTQLAKVEQPHPSATNSFGGLLDDLFVPSTTGKFTEDGSISISKSAASLQKAFDDLAKSAMSVYKVYEQQGTSGAVGAGASMLGGGLSDVSKSLPTESALGKGLGAAGGVLSLVGGVVSMMTGIFQQAAQDIGRAIGREISHTMQQLQGQQINLFQALNQLQAERNKLITELAGKKGGQKVLDQMLPNIDSQIASMKAQQTNLTNQFVSSIRELQGSAGGVDVTMKSWLTTWIGLNEQARDYLNAVGAAAGAQNAQAFLQLNLQEQTHQLQLQQNQGQQQAVGDAINLNDMLYQRNQLERQYQQTVFSIQNSDAVERRGNYAIENARKTALAAGQYEHQLQQLNFQLDVTKQKVDYEKQIFHIASDTASLQKESLNLQLLGLSDMLTKYTSIGKLLASITGLQAGSGINFGFPGAGMFSGTQTIGGIPGVDNSTTNYAVTVNVGAGADGKTIANEFIREMQYRQQSRGGYGLLAT